MRRRFITIMLGIILCHPLFARDSVRYASALLRETVLRLKLDEKVEPAPSNEKRFRLEKANVVVRFDELGVVEHVGVPVFDSRLRDMVAPVALDYVEYCLLNHIYRLSEKMLNANDMLFTTGNWDALLQKDIAKVPVSVQFDQEKHLCQITWKNNEKVLAELYFKLQYDRISRSTMEELELRLWQKIMNNTEREWNVPTPEDLEETGVKGLRMNCGDNFQILTVESTTYYDDKGKLVCDKHLPMPSLCNLLLSPDSNLPSKQLVATRSKDSSTYKTTLRNMVQYFVAHGLRLYAGIKEVKNGQITATLYAVDNHLACYHMFSIVTEVNTLAKKNAVIEAKVQMYIPMN